MSRFSKDKRRWFFFDFDGTLAPIAPTPEKAVLPAQTRSLLNKLSTVRGVKVGIVSGRQVDDVRKKVGLRHLTYIGNHGIEVLYNHRLFIEPRARRLKRSLLALARSLGAKVSRIPGALLENKRYTLSLHFRRVHASDHAALVRLAQTAIVQGPGGSDWTLRRGKKVIEIRPHSGWNKGKGIAWVLKRSPAGRRVFYIGDDQTDEDVFRMMKKTAITVRVGHNGRSAARYRLPKQSQVNQLLTMILSRCA